MAGDDFRSQVLQATDIVQLISESVALKRRGKDYVGLCPFHSEKTPSFHVSPSKQFFHCYGCKEGGNAIDFVIKRDRLEFIDALRMLGERAGLEMPQRGAAKQKTGERQMLLDANSAACAFFQRLLKDPANGAKAREYLASRGFSEAIATQFQVGVALDSWDALLSALGRKFPADVLVTAGLVKPRERGSGFYDTFRNRLMFPIRDEGGRVIAFGGRTMPGSQDPAKYLNSPETPLFSKSRCVFGLDLARHRIVETRTAVVVEGYADVMMAHQHGASNVVSILGTALTEQHVKVLQRFADRIVLLFDADTAGDKAVDKAVDLFLRQPIEIAIASMPEGVDPDEFLIANGAEAFDSILAQAKDALSYKWQQLQKRLGADADSLTGRQKAVNDYLETIAAARGAGPVDPMRWGQILLQLQKRTGLSIEALNRRFGPVEAASGSRPQMRNEPNFRPGGRNEANFGPRGRNEANFGSQGRNEANFRERDHSGAGPGERNEPNLASGRVDRRQWTAQDRAERWLLGILLNEPNRWQDVQLHVHVHDFTDRTRAALAEVYWTYQRDEGEPVFSEFISLLEDPAVKQLAVELMQEAQTLPDVDATVQDTIRHFGEVAARREEQELMAALHRNEQEGNAVGGQAPAEEIELALLKQLQEKARQPDLRRVGMS